MVHIELVGVKTNPVKSAGNLGSITWQNFTLLLTYISNLQHVLILYQSINQTSIAPISPTKSGSVAPQPDQCSSAKSMKLFCNINRRSGARCLRRRGGGRRPSQKDVLRRLLIVATEVAERTDSGRLFQREGVQDLNALEPLLVLKNSLFIFIPCWLHRFLPVHWDQTMIIVCQSLGSTPILVLELFTLVTPSLWNNLPLLSVCSASSVATFKKYLKTHLFDLALPP